MRSPRNAAKYTIASVADVRRLATCKICGRLGMHGTDLVLVSFKADARGRKRDKLFAHAFCLPIQELLALPYEELGTTRISDVSAEDLQRVLAQLERLRERS